MTKRATAMTRTKATVWTQADANGFYWWRYDKDATPEPVEVRDGVFYCIADTDPTSMSLGEFLGPITPELCSERNALLREVAQLREALDNVLQCFRNGAMPDRSIVGAAEAVLAKER
jgi:hypothetical protein